MSKAIYEIYSEDILIAQKYNLSKINSNIFPTPEVASFQFGVGVSNNEKILKPHIHKRVDRTINNTAEFIFVLDGKVIVDIYDEREHFVETINICANECLLQFLGGHAILLNENTKYFEIKQGPYGGRDFDKYDLRVKNNG